MSLTSCDFDGKDISVLKYTFLIYTIANSISFLLIFLNLVTKNYFNFFVVVSNLVFMFILIFVSKKFSKFISARNIILSVILFNIIQIIDLFILFLYPIPPFEHVLSSNMLIAFESIFNNIALICLLILLVHLSWLLFIYYISNWFNRLFSVNRGKVKLLLYSAILSFISGIFDLYGLLLFWYNYNLNNGYLTTEFSSLYGTVFRLAYISLIFYFLSNFTSIIAWFLFYRRIQEISLIRKNPIFSGMDLIF